MAARKSRIAQSYVQLVPFIDDQFAKELQKQINSALRNLDFSALSSAMRSEGKKAGRALRMGLESGLGNASPDINTRQMISEAGVDGKQAGREIRKGLDAGVGNGAPDVGLDQLAGEATGEGKQAGAKLKAALESAASPIQMPQVTGAAAAGAQAGQQAGSSMADAIKEQLAGVLSAGAAMAAAGFGVKNAIDQDAGSREIAASLALTEEQADRTTAAVRNLYKTAWADDGTEEAEIAVESALSVFPKLREKSQEEIERVSQRALMMNQLYEADVEKVTQVAGGMYATGFATSIENAYDLIDTAYRETPVALRGDMLDTLDEFSMHFANMGIKGTSAIGILKEFSKNAGTYSMQQSAEGIKEVGLKLGNIDDTGARDALKTIGLEHKEIAAGILEGGDAADKALEKVIKGILGIEDQATRAKTAIAIFGTPLEEIGVPNIDKYLSNILLAGDYLGDIRSEAQKAEDDARDTLDVKLKAITATAIQTFTDIFAPIVEKLIPVMQWVLDLINNNKELFQVLAVVALIAAAAIGAVMAIGAAGWFIAGVPAALAFAASLWAVVAPAIAAAAPFILMGIAIAALLAVALFVGIQIGKFLYDLFTNWDGTMEAIKTNFNAFVDAVGEIVDSIFDWLGKAPEEIVKIVEQVGAWIGDWIAEHLDFVGQQFEDMFNFIGRAFEGLSNWWDSLWASNDKKTMELSVNTKSSGLPKMATGGDIMYRSGGTDVTVGEVEPETIVNRGGMNRLIENTNRLIEGGAGGGKPQEVTLNVYPAQGMSEEQLARMVIDRLAWESGRR